MNASHPLEDVLITVHLAGGCDIRAARTDANGTYFFAVAIPPGNG